MAVLRSSILIAFLFFSFACSAEKNNVIIFNQIKGCFGFESWQLNIQEEPVVLHVSVKQKNKNMECPCKSALIKYTASQKIEGSVSNLLTGYFTTLGKDSVILPVSVQKQIIFPKIPIEITLSCSNQ